MLLGEIKLLQRRKRCGLYWYYYPKTESFTTTRGCPPLVIMAVSLNVPPTYLPTVHRPSHGRCGRWFYRPVCLNTTDHHRPMPNDHRRPFLHHRPAEIECTQFRSASILLVGRQEWHSPCKNWVVGCWHCCVWVTVHNCIWHRLRFTTGPVLETSHFAT